VSFWAETRVVVSGEEVWRCTSRCCERMRERYTNQTVMSLRVIATRVFDPETFSSPRRIAIMTGWIFGPW
jgi:hypothetical protein